MCSPRSINLTRIFRAIAKRTIGKLEPLGLVGVAVEMLRVSAQRRLRWRLADVADELRRALGLLPRQAWEHVNALNAAAAYRAVVLVSVQKLAFRVLGEQVDALEEERARLGDLVERHA